MAPRQQIREKLKIELASIFTQTFDYRPSQIFEEDLPSCSIYFEDGETEYDFDQQGVTQGRLVIEVIARESGNLDKALDLLGTSVNTAINTDPTLNSLVENIQRTGFLYDRDPDSNSGGLSLFHSVHYYDED